ncbi:hypothetical protein CCYN49044_200099 [Capnocytophaga cynodegmi]|nr:hypothetical protein CCYN49044_200099 [Capnocytophaga cynodegmi]
MLLIINRKIYNKNPIFYLQLNTINYEIKTKHYEYQHSRFKESSRNHRISGVNKAVKPRISY